MPKAQEDRRCTNRDARGNLQGQGAGCAREASRGKYEGTGRQLLDVYETVSAWIPLARYHEML